MQIRRHGVLVVLFTDHLTMGVIHIKTENGQIISHNKVHLHETNVEFVPQVQNIPKVSKVLKEEKIVNQIQILISPQSLKQ